MTVVKFPLVGSQEGFVFRTKANELRAFANVVRVLFSVSVSPHHVN